MSNLGNQLIAWLIYPGMLTSLVLAVVIAWLAQLRAPGGGLRRGLQATLRGEGSSALMIAALIPLLVGATLPWPGSPRPLAPGDLWLGWALLEVSYWLALLPALQQTTVLGVRAAMREAQLSAVGRMLVWSSLGVSVWAGTPWTWATLPVHALAALAAVLALPAAFGWGTYSPANDVTPGGPEAGLSQIAAQMAHWGRVIRTTVLLSVVPVVLQQGWPDLHYALRAALVVVIMLLLAVWGRSMNGSSVRRPLLAAIRLCWTSSLPLLTIAILVLLIFGR